MLPSGVLIRPVHVTQSLPKEPAYFGQLDIWFEEMATVTTSWRTEVKQDPSSVALGPPRCHQAWNEAVTAMLPVGEEGFA